MTFVFRPIVPDDIATLHRWRNLPHVSRWWEPSKITLDEAKAEYAHYMKPDHKVDAYIVSHEGRDIGYMQRWRVADFPDYKPYVPLTDAVQGLDVFIGEADLLHKGIGTRLIRAYITAYVFHDADVPAVIIDPLPDNKAAIRAYEKVGFVHERTFTHDGIPVYLMRLKREDFAL